VSPGEGGFEFHEVLGGFHECASVFAVVQTPREKLHNLELIASYVFAYTDLYVDSTVVNWSSMLVFLRGQLSSLFILESQEFQFLETN
jgi:hypothetical protein